MDAQEIEEDSTGDRFMEKLLLHHFDDWNEVQRDGTVYKKDENGEPILGDDVIPFPIFSMLT